MSKRLKLADMRAKASYYGMYIHKRFGGYFVLSYSDENYASDTFSGSLRDISHFLSGMHMRNGQEARERCVIAVGYSAYTFTDVVSQALYYSTHGTLINGSHQSIDSENALNLINEASKKMRWLFQDLRGASPISPSDRAELLTQVAQITAEAMERIWGLKWYQFEDNTAL